MGFYIDANGNYYEGDKASPSDAAVLQRPSPFYAWSGAVWAQDDDVLKSEVKVKAQKILDGSDWSALEDVTTLTNKAEWIVYRKIVRAIRLNPTVDAVFPPEPGKVWTPL